MLKGPGLAKVSFDLCKSASEAWAGHSLRKRFKLEWVSLVRFKDNGGCESRANPVDEGPIHPIFPKARIDTSTPNPV
jgi:hypothetical protein